MTGDVRTRGFGVKAQGEKTMHRPRSPNFKEALSIVKRPNGMAAIASGVRIIRAGDAVESSALVTSDGMCCRQLGVRSSVNSGRSSQRMECRVTRPSGVPSHDLLNTENDAIKRMNWIQMKTATC